jgi:hypothetical protein
MTRLVAALAVFLVACSSGCSHPAPQPVVPPTPASSSCDEVCALATSDRCDWGANCVLACTNADSVGFVRWDTACMAAKLQAGDCEAADACSR